MAFLAIFIGLVFLYSLVSARLERSVPVARTDRRNPDFRRPGPTANRGSDRSDAKSIRFLTKNQWSDEQMLWYIEVCDRADQEEVERIGQPQFHSSETPLLLLSAADSS